jgi:hypothetical protein
VPTTIPPAGDVVAVPVSVRKSKSFAASIYFRSNPGFAAVDAGRVASGGSQGLIFVGRQELSLLFNLRVRAAP